MIRGLIILVAFLSACAAPPPPDVPRTAVFDRCGAGQARVHESVVKVQTNRGSCTGVVISGNEVLTAGHCVEDVDYAAVVVDGLARFAPRSIYGGPFGEDVAILLVDVADVPFARLGSPASPGQVIVAHGFGCVKPHGEHRVMQSKAHYFIDVHAHEVSGCACGGDSGGPVFDLSGSVVGVVTHADRVRMVFVTDASVVPYLRAAASLEFGHVPMTRYAL